MLAGLRQAVATHLLPDRRQTNTTPPAGLFIAGTDTGVGKTIIACAIARLLADHGMDVGVMKPVETGCRIRNGRLFPVDGAALKAAARSEAPLSTIAFYRYRLPVAPHAAAQIARRPVVDLSRVAQRFQTQRQKHAFMIVEGIGGLLVPLSAQYDLIDLILAFDLPVLLVARSGLGTLNHTLLTLRHGSDRGVRFIGAVLNQTTPRRTLADATNPAMLAERCALPVFSFPYCERKSVSGGDSFVLALARAHRTPTAQGLLRKRGRRRWKRNKKAESLQQWLFRIVKKTTGFVVRTNAQNGR